MRTILVTGGCGFIGSNFIRHILQATDWRVVNVDSLTYAGTTTSLKGVEESSRYAFVRGDITDGALVSQAVGAYDADTIVHFASESHVDNSIENPAVFVRTNVLGTYALLEVARRHNIRFHNVSTDEVFGSLRNDDPPFTETHNYAPHSPYSATKAAADHLVNAYYHTYGLKTTVSNCSNNYGPFQFPEKLIPLFVTNLMLGKKVGVYGDGKNVRDWLHVDDHCRALRLILEDGRIGETYCVGGSAQRSNLEVTRAILAEMGMGDDMIQFVKDRPGHDFRYAISHAKIAAELGWQPTVSFEEGIHQTVAWYRNNEWWWRPLRKH